MTDFIFPFTPVRNRKTVTSELGLGTLLSNASPVSDKWAYMRRPWPDENDDGNSGRSGIATVEPAPGSPEFREAEAARAALQAMSPDTKTATAATALTAAGQTTRFGEGIAALAARAAPLALAAAPAAALAVPFVAVPKIAPKDETVLLGNDLRARLPIGQRSVIFERRVDDGLFGTGIGAKWEELPPVEATFGVGPPGRRPVLVDGDQLRGAIGADAADRLLAMDSVIDRRNAANGGEAADRVQSSPGGNKELPPPPIALPSKIEMRIGVSINGEIEKREASREDVLEVCPNYAEYERIAMEAAEKHKAAGMVNGPEYGKKVHREMEQALKGDIQTRLEERGIKELRPEVALLKGIPESYTKGSSRLDVLELHRDHVTVCVYELKTGGATVRGETMERYLREASLYAEARNFGYPNVYFIPIHVP